MRKITFFLGIILFFPFYSISQSESIIDIPDPNFKAALLAIPTINTNGDDEIQLSEASNFSGTLNVQNKNISDLTGIQAFTNITELICKGNNLTSIDLSGNVGLNILQCNTNHLNSLDLTANTALSMLFCGNNNLSSLDLSSNLNLSYCSR